MKKRFLAALLAALAVALLLPAAAFAESYSLWVNGTEVTSENAGNVLGDSGTVSYDAATNTLTLNGATINTPNPTSVSSIYSAGIYAEGAIQIQLIGENSITITSGQIVAGIHANGVITIGGAGALNVTASGASIETRAISTGYTENDYTYIYFNGGTVTVDADGTSGIYAVYVDGSYGASTAFPRAISRSTAARWSWMPRLPTLILAMPPTPSRISADMQDIPLPPSSTAGKSL